MWRFRAWRRIALPSRGRRVPPRLPHTTTSWTAPTLVRSYISHAPATRADANPESLVRAREVADKTLRFLWRLAQGNAKFRESFDSPSQAPPVAAVDRLLLDPLSPDSVTPKALIICCAHSPAGIHSMFDLEFGEFRVLRSCGNICVPNKLFDGLVGSAEVAVNETGVPLLLVLGNTQNFVVEAAVRLALLEIGSSLKGAPDFDSDMSEYDTKDMDVVQAVLPSARDAIRQAGNNASFEELCTLTGQLNVWSTVEALMTTSSCIYDKVVAGDLYIHGAYYHGDTGVVQFLGTHPAQPAILKERPLTESRTAKTPMVPPEEAFTNLYTGNLQYAMGNQREIVDRVTLQANLMNQRQDGQCPLAVILGGADSVAPTEHLFNAQVGDLFVLRNAGNICPGNEGGMLGSAEFAITALGAKLILVLGHTSCEAVRRAVEAVRQKRSYKRYAGEIGTVLEHLHLAAASAVERLPDAEADEQVRLAISLNVFRGIENMIRHSKIIREGVETSELQLHGAIYDVGTGEVQWLGQHRDLEEIMGIELPMWRWKATPYESPTYTIDPAASPTLSKLQEGNLRFMNGETTAAKYHPGRPRRKPNAVVLSNAEGAMPVETIFDVSPGDLVTQKCVGNIAGYPGSSLFASMEYAVAYFSPKLLLVMGECPVRGTDSDLIRLLSMKDTTFGALPTRTVVRQMSVGAVRAVEQVDKLRKTDVGTSAGHDIQVLEAASELNVFYTIERLILGSEVIRTAAQFEEMEIHGALFDRTTGRVHFLGPHPVHDELLKMSQWTTPVACVSSIDGAVMNDHQYLTPRFDSM
eukprot:TRINITY_DN8191_c0_g1_i1.p1 TRINITY_DN8191_c0_g1~~TRINITY_DN8191_c0_g1_i1.p1  ORF type:complete len:809 (+),score=197.04 TRINITY_DN8191_c0_g1_i1:103-2529(+)